MLAAHSRWWKTVDSSRFFYRHKRGCSGAGKGPMSPSGKGGQIGVHV